MSISALILTKNEEAMIHDCIAQLNFVDEILVLDQNSNDKTTQIAEKLGAKIIKSQNNRFDLDRNILKDKSSGEWLLYVDADERLPEATIAEIKKLITKKTYSAYYFPRQNYILGRWLKHGGWWPDYVPRLFAKKDLIGWEGPVHESPTIKGKFGHAENPIKHLTARNISRMLDKSTKWANIEAQLYAKSNYPPVTKVKVTKAIIGEFTRRFILKLGFLDGLVGLIQAIFQSLHVAMILVYLWEIQNKSIEIYKEAKHE